MLRHVLGASQQPGLAGKSQLGLGKTKKSELGWLGRRLGMTGLRSIIPAQMSLAGGGRYTGISAKGRKHAMHGAQPGWAFAIARGSDHHCLRSPEVSRVFRELRRA